MPVECLSPVKEDHPPVLSFEYVSKTSKQSHNNFQIFSLMDHSFTAYG